MRAIVVSHFKGEALWGETIFSMTPRS